MTTTATIRAVIGCLDRETGLYEVLNEEGCLVVVQWDFALQTFAEVSDE